MLNIKIVEIINLYRSDIVTEEMIDKQINLLCSKDTNIGYEAMKILQEASEESNAIYKYMNHFFQMLKDNNSYICTRALVLIAANAKWDTEYKIDEVIDLYLQHITNKKPITSRQCIKMLPTIAKYKPELKEDIIFALRRADISFYNDSMRQLVYKDINEALLKINMII